MMAEHDFTAQVMQPLPTLLTSPDTLRSRPMQSAKALPVVHYRRLPTETFPLFKRGGHGHGEVHWRESGPVMILAPHRTANTRPTAPASDTTATTGETRQQHSASHHGEVHWRES